MSRIVQVGSVEGHPVFGYAPSADGVPSQFELDTPMLACRRPGCAWRHHVEGDPLTEVVALAIEHVQEAHHG